MTKEEKKNILTEWEDIITKSHNEIDKVCHELNANPEFLPFQVSFKLMEAYTKTVSLIVGDKSNWLNWYFYDSRVGGRVITIGNSASKSGKEEHYTIEKASDFIEYDIF